MRKLTNKWYRSSTKNEDLGSFNQTQDMDLEEENKMESLQMDPDEFLYTQAQYSTQTSQKRGSIYQ